MQREWIIKKFDELSSEELYSIIRERINVFVVEQNCSYAECDDKDRKAFHLYAKQDGKIIAYLRILLPGVSYQEASIGRVLTNKEYRGKGLAKEMMLRAIDFIEKELRETKIKISAQEYAAGFYEGVNFRIASERYFEDDIPHVEMVYEK